MDATSLREPIEKFVGSSNTVSNTLLHLPKLYHNNSISERREIKNEMYSRLKQLLKFASEIQKKDLTGAEHAAIQDAVKQLEGHVIKKEGLTRESRQVQLKLDGKERPKDMGLTRE